VYRADELHQHHIQLVNQIQPHFDSISTPVRPHFHPISTSFRPHFDPSFIKGPISTRFRPDFDPISTQIRHHFDTISTRFRPDFDIILKPFRTHFDPISIPFCHYLDPIWMHLVRSGEPRGPQGGREPRAEAALHRAHAGIIPAPFSFHFRKMIGTPSQLTIGQHHDSSSITGVCEFIQFGVSGP
jgi:hypothetical protein